MMTQILGFFTPWIIYGLITFLHYILPGRWVTGYVKHLETGELLRYRLNGRLVLIVMIGLWFLLGYLGWISYDWLYEIRWYSLAGAFVFGLLFSFWIVLPYPAKSKSIVSDLFLGRLENPNLKTEKLMRKCGYTL